MVGEGWSVVAAMVVWVVMHYLVKRGKGGRKGVDPFFYIFDFSDFLTWVVGLGYLGWKWYWARKG